MQSVERKPVPGLVWVSEVSDTRGNTVERFESPDGGTVQLRVTVGRLPKVYGPEYLALAVAQVETWYWASVGTVDTAGGLTGVKVLPAIGERG